MHSTSHIKHTDSVSTDTHTHTHTCVHAHTPYSDNHILKYCISEGFGQSPSGLLSLNTSEGSVPGTVVIAYSLAKHDFSQRASKHAHAS